MVVLPTVLALQVSAVVLKAVEASVAVAAAAVVVDSSVKRFVDHSDRAGRECGNPLMGQPLMIFGLMGMLE